MNTVLHGLDRQPEAFLWAVGIEDTAIGEPIRDGGRSLDEFELTEHYERWRSDLDLTADLGCTAIRYGIPWYRINPQPGVWDWAWLDQALEYAVLDAGLTVIADLVHYGTPMWLPKAFSDPRYPEAVAEFGSQLATRYRGLVSHFTPLNEPLITASFCGQRAVWPPYDTGDAGWSRVVMAVVDGIQQTTAAIRAAQPEATIVHVEAAHVWTSREPELQEQVRHQELRSFLPTDLLTGRVGSTHPLYEWLISQGIPAAELNRLRENAQSPDLVGVNYYPVLNCRELVTHEGAVVGIAFDGGSGGLARVLNDYHERYELPVMLSETGIDGDPEDHSAWLKESVATIGELRSKGVPVQGFTWWPLYDSIDWSWASAGRIVEEFYIRTPPGDPDGVITPVYPPVTESDDLQAYLRRMGLYRLGGSRGGLDRIATSAVDDYRALIRTPIPALAGDLA